MNDFPNPDNWITGAGHEGDGLGDGLVADSTRIETELAAVEHWHEVLLDRGHAADANRLFARIQDLEHDLADALAREDDAWGYARGPRYDGQAGRRL